MTTNTQTESRALAQAREIILKASINDWDKIIELIATALTEKDAELTVARDSRAAWKKTSEEQTARAERAEAELAAAHKSIEDMEYTDGDAQHWRHLTKWAEAQLATLKAENERLHELADKYKWQVRDTYARVKRVEAQLAEARKMLTPVEVAGLVERLQDRATVMETLSPDFAATCREAASLIQLQAARISKLEADRD